MANSFELNNIAYQYNGNAVLQGISLEIPQGLITGILGPNGSGKTTLLRVLSGLYQPSRGSVTVNHKLLKEYSKHELAKQIAFLEQNHSTSLPFTVREVVEMGRYPWLKPLAPLGAKDQEIVEYALHCFNLTAMQERLVETLSGGERQLVSLARAMAQEPRILILDEPTTYLDIGHQNMVMEYLYKWHKSLGTTIVMVIHDLNLSSQFCDYLVVLEQGKLVVSGPKEEVLCEELFTRLYNTKLAMVRHPVSGVPQFLPAPPRE